MVRSKIPLREGVAQCIPSFLRTQESRKNPSLQANSYSATPSLCIPTQERGNEDRMSSRSATPSRGGVPVGRGGCGRVVFEKHCYTNQTLNDTNHDCIQPPPPTTSRVATCLLSSTTATTPSGFACLPLQGGEFGMYPHLIKWLEH